MFFKLNIDLGKAALCFGGDMFMLCVHAHMCVHVLIGLPREVID